MVDYLDALGPGRNYSFELYLVPSLPVPIFSLIGYKAIRHTRSLTKLVFKSPALNCAPHHRSSEDVDLNIVKRNLKMLLYVKRGNCLTQQGKKNHTELSSPTEQISICKLVKKKS